VRITKKEFKGIVVPIVTPFKNNEGQEIERARVEMRKLELKGIVVPMVTPFKSNKKQDLDEEKLRDLVNFLLDSGVHALMPCGGTGESVSLSPEENRKVIEITVDEVNGKVPVIGGAKSPGTKNSVDLAKGAKEAGADAVLVQGPYYIEPITEEGYYEHFRTVADEVDIPVLVYNLPRVQGKDIPVNVISRLADLENIIGLKNSTPNMLHASEAVTVCRQKGIAYMQGLAHLFLPSLVLGAQGSITSVLNVGPALFVDLFDSFTKGNMDRARELHFRLMPLMKLGGSPVMVKAALEMMGHPMGPPRKPLMPAAENERKKISDVLSTLGLIR
jgi:4-hydroxy-tetrahydrodipicolinate synthase